MIKKRAFTLFELLVSISIIGILVAVASTSYGLAQKKARDARRVEDMNAIQKAAEQYYSTHNYSYPGSSSDFVSGGVLNSWPMDPKTLSVYSFSTVAATNSYCSCVLLENTTAGNSTTNACAFAASGSYFCIKNQQ